VLAAGDRGEDVEPRRAPCGANGGEDAGDRPGDEHGNEWPRRDGEGGHREVSGGGLDECPPEEKADTDPAERAKDTDDDGLPADDRSKRVRATIRADGISTETASSAVTAVTPVPQTLVASTVRAAIAGAAPLHGCACQRLQRFL
jgi:hypothetical protein